MIKKRIFLISTISLVVVGAVTAALLVPLLNKPDSSSSKQSSSSSTLSSEPSLAETFTITWKNYDGTVLEVDQEVMHGTMPTYEGATPTRAQTAEFTYEFSGWMPDIVVATSDATYTATFDDAVNKYPITWINEDGTVLDIQELAYGALPAFTKETPTKAKNAEFTYTFSVWEPEVVTVTKAATYTATYTETRNNYAVTWLNDDGTLLHEDLNVPYGTVPEYTGAVPEKASEPHRTFAFNGWSPEVNAVVGDVTYIAVFSATFKTFTITLDLNGGTFNEPETLLTIDVIYSSDFVLPVLNTPTNSPFGGWYYAGERIADEFGDSLTNYLFTEDITVVAEYFYPIYTRADLENITNNLNGTYRLMNDLDLKDEEWVPINGFAGEFNGQGFTISGMTILTYYESVGLFGEVDDATITNLTLSDSLIEFASPAQPGNVFVGGIIGSSHNNHDLMLSALTNESFVMNVDERSFGYVGFGGILGNYESTGGTTLAIIDSLNASEITGEFYESLGGLVGRIMTLGAEITVTRSGNSGKITTSLYTGGLIGDFYDTNSLITIEDSYNAGEIIGLAHLGGLIGQMRLFDRSTITLENSYNTNDISGTATGIGGLIGTYSAADFAELNIIRSSNEGNISGEERLGGLVGSASRSGQRQFMPEVHISNSYNLGDITSDIRGTLGGLIGYGFNYFTITNSYNAGNLNAPSERHGELVGGLVGWAQSGGIITNSINFGIVRANALAGSIIGRNYENAVVFNNTYFTNEVYKSNGQLLPDATLGGTLVDAATIDASFFSDTLLWDDAVWDYTNINITEEIYPILK
ncbi:MAG TPA: hypothetical protein VFD05_02000 [Bacilli bacterium]|nr:hypothetical protein [Bacilli bacterium]